MKKSISSLFVLFSFTFALLPLPSAAAVDDGYILSDADLFAANTMTAEEIQIFLSEHSGTLKSHASVDIDGLLKTASMIIYDAAQRHRVNPQALLVMLQKEQGLITDPEPFETQYHWATGYAVCDDCDVDHPFVQKFKGFAKQVDSSAEFFRYVTENLHKFHFDVGETYVIDGKEVTIKTRATAMLYNYTPHLRGNRNFAKLWTSWFEPLVYPNGSLLQAVGEPGVWLIRDGFRHPFTSESSFTSRFSFSQIIPVSPDLLEQYPVGAAISFSQYSLLRTTSGDIYLLVDDQLRHIIDEATFRSLGYTEDEITDVTEESLAFFSQGQPITTESLNPLGALLQDPETFGIYFVKDGIKYPLIAPELLSLNFEGKRVRKSTIEELDRYVKGSPVLLKDGLLVKSANSPTVYVISEGQKRMIDSEETFLSLGYTWTSIHTISDRLLELHPDGTILSITQEFSDSDATLLVDQEPAL